MRVDKLQKQQQPKPQKLKPGVDTAKYSSAAARSGDVTVEDVDAEEEDPNEMTDNTPEARVEVVPPYNLTVKRHVYGACFIVYTIRLNMSH